MAALSKPSRPALTLAFDYGTSTLAASYSIKDGQLDAISFNGNGGLQVDQKVAWDKDGNFLYGRAVDTAVDEGIIEPGDVIVQWKLCLCPDFEKSHLARHVQVQLKRYGKTLHQLIAEHFRAMTRDVKRNIKGGKYGHGDLGELIDAMPVRLIVSVPNMWEVPECHNMATAAKEAGIDEVKIVFEPQCAAAFILHGSSLLKGMKEGSIVCVADTGGGTSDYVAYEILPGPDWSNLDLRKVGTARGSMAGSQFVTMNFLHRLTTKAWEFDDSNKTFEQRCEELGRTKEDVYNIAGDRFEEHKKAFSGRSTRTKDITIGGVELPGQPREIWTVKISSAQMKSFYQLVVDKNFTELDELLQELEDLGKRATHIAVVGGLRYSQFYWDQLETKYGESYKLIGDPDSELRLSHVVAHGAHYRLSDIETEMPKDIGSFGVERDEEFDEKLHTDVYTIRTRKGKKEKIFKPRLSYQADGQRWVRRRWQRVDGKDGGIDLLYFVRPHEAQQQMKLQIWWTREDVADGAPFLTEDGKHDREGFVRFGKPIVKQCLDWEAEGFKLGYTKKTVAKKVEEIIDELNDPASDSDYSDHGDQDDHEDDEYDDPMDVDHDELEQTKTIQKAPAKIKELRSDMIYAPTPTEKALIRDVKEIDPLDVFIKGKDEKIEMKDGRSWLSLAGYQVYTKLTVTSDGANTSTKWMAIKPGTQSFTVKGKPKKGKRKTMQVLGKEDVVELIDAAFSPYARG